MNISPLVDYVEKLKREMDIMHLAITSEPVEAIDEDSNEEVIIPVNLLNIINPAVDLCVTAEHITEKLKSHDNLMRRPHTRLLKLLKGSKVKTQIRDLKEELNMFIIQNVNVGLVSEEFIRFPLHDRIIWLQGLLTNLETELLDEEEANV